MVLETSGHLEQEGVVFQAIHGQHCHLSQPEQRHLGAQYWKFESELSAEGNETLFLSFLALIAVHLDVSDLTPNSLILFPL